MSLSPPDILSDEWGWENIRRDVFQLIAWGHEMAREEIRTRQVEEDITGLIRKGINEKLDEELPPRFRFYSAHNEDPVDDDHAFGKDRPRVDILIECSGGRPRTRYRLEGKRCARSTKPIAWYATGIQSFVQRRYAKGAPEAGLLGLMQSDTAEYWKARLSAKLNEDSSLSCRGPLVDRQLTPDLPDMSSSEHQRNDGAMITLYHAFLDCR